MITVVFGGASSGKSKIAEDIATSQGKKLCYIATMIPFSDEAKERVEKHKLKRLNKGFHTIEKYTDVENAEIADFHTALLECMGNWLANEMFENGGKENAVEQIIAGVEILKNKIENLIIVTNDVFKGGFNYDVESQKYIDNYAKITNRMFEMADIFIEVKCGIAIYHKGEHFEKSI